MGGPSGPAADRPPAPTANVSLPPGYPRPILPDRRLQQPQRPLPRFFPPSGRRRTPTGCEAADFLPYARRRWPRRTRSYRPEATYRPELLARHGLPRLATVDDLAAALGVTVGKLKWLTWPVATGRWGRLGGGPDHYVRRELPKRSGGKRLLRVPKPETRRTQDWILREILSRVPVNPCAHGFRPGRSILTNARQHAGKELVVNLDLEDFFPRISFATVDGVFECLGYPQEVAWCLAMLCTCRYGRRWRRALPQGAPTSPALANLVCWKLDRRLTGLAGKFGAAYTRYADDLTFSGDGDFIRGLERFLPLLGRICAEEGMRLNAAKTRFMRRCHRQEVTGLVVNDRPGLTRRERRVLRAILHNCRTRGAVSQNHTGDPLFRQRLRGRIALVRMVHPQQAERLEADFWAVEW